jgi:hypothetical protein
LCGCHCTTLYPSALHGADPSPRASHHPDHRLPAGVHMNVLDRDFLLAQVPAAMRRPCACRGEAGNVLTCDRSACAQHLLISPVCSKRTLATQSPLESPQSNKKLLFGRSTSSSSTAVFLQTHDIRRTKPKALTRLSLHSDAPRQILFWDGPLPAPGFLIRVIWKGIRFHFSLLA